MSARLDPGLSTDIRLADATPQQRADYLDRTHRLLRSRYRVPGLVEFVQATGKSAVLRVVADDVVHAVKVFADPDAFLRELLNARLVRHHGSFVRLRWFDRAEHALCYEWLTGVGELPDPVTYCTHLARVHTVYRTMPTEVRAVVQRVAGAGPPGYPCAVVDQKAAHLGYRAAAPEPVLLDLECLRFGHPTTTDLAAVPLLYGLDRDSDLWDACLHGYAEQVGCPVATLRADTDAVWRRAPRR